MHSTKLQICRRLLSGTDRQSEQNHRVYSCKCACITCIDLSLSFLLLFATFLTQRRGVYENSVRRSIGAYTEDRPATDDRPTKALIGENFKRPYLRDGSSDSLHVWFYGGVFGVGGSNGAISGFAKSKMAAWLPSWKIQIAISTRWIIRFTPCFVLGWGFQGSRIEWRYFRFQQIQ